MKNLQFRNEETNEAFDSSRINEMPSGLYNCIDLFHTMLLITNDRNILVSGFNHGISEETIEDEFSNAFIPVEYYETDKHPKDFLIKKELL